MQKVQAASYRNILVIETNLSEEFQEILEKYTNFSCFAGKMPFLIRKEKVLSSTVVGTPL